MTIVAITGAEATTGGIATHNRNILRALSSEGAQMRWAVISLHETANARPPSLDQRVHFYACNGSKLLFATRLLILSVRRPLIIFDHVTLALPVIPLSIVGWVKMAVIAHGSEAGKRVRRMSRLTFRHAKLVLTNSEFTKKSMEAWGGRGNIEICPLGLAPGMPTNEKNRKLPPRRRCLHSVDGEDVELGDRVLLLVARLHPQEREKGHDQLLAIAPRLVEEFPEAQLVFAGPGDDRDRLAEVARSKGVGASVFLPGRVEESVLQDLYRICFAYVMPSRQEGFGLVHLEAMNFGKACLACKNDGAAEVVVDGETGILIENPDDQAELLRALRSLLSQPERTAELGRAGFARLHQHFTARQVQERIRQHLIPLIRC